MSRWILIDCQTISDINKLKFIIKSFKAKLKDFIVNKDYTCSVCIEYDKEEIFPAIELFLKGN